MEIFVHCIVRNEARMLPYFLRHYETFADWMYFYDEDSTDGTRELIKAHPKACLFDWPGTKGIVDDEFRDFAQNEYKMARPRPDWVIWPDCDEFIYHPDLRGILWEYKKQGVEVPLINGFNMIAKQFPTTTGQIYDEIKTGYWSEPYSKPIVFQAHVDMCWKTGRHFLEEGFHPKRSETAEIKLLHYRYIDPEWVKFKNTNNWNRMDKAHQDANHGWTCNPNYHGEHSYTWYMKKREEQLPNVV